MTEQYSSLYNDNSIAFIERANDFSLLCQLGTNEIMTDAIGECKQNFEEFWRQKLVNTLRALHNLNFSNEDLSDENNEPIPEKNNIDTTNWILTKRIEQ